MKLTCTAKSDDGYAFEFEWDEGHVRTFALKESELHQLKSAKTMEDMCYLPGNADLGLFHNRIAAFAIFSLTMLHRGSLDLVGRTIEVN